MAGVDDGRIDAELLTLTQELAEITRLVDDDDVPATVRRLVSRVVRTVPQCDHALVVMRTERGFEVVADDPEPEARLGPVAGPPGDLGPVGEVLEFAEPRRLDDTTTDQRWPGFSAALAQAGYRSALLLPLPVQRADGAAFALLSRTPEAFGAASFDLVLLFALHAGAAVDNATLLRESRDLVDQLGTALGTRQTIGRAEGLLMREFECDVPQAFALLQRASQNSNTKLRDVAAGLIEAHEQGTLPAELGRFGIEAPAA